MLVWVILPPNFDDEKVSNTFILPRRTTKRPDAILFFPLEFSVNGCNGYIVVAPNRRGMPGYGVEE
jgi:dipeptidyl aminopeptidase/acylaminoacyl peptidase